MQRATAIQQRCRLPADVTVGGPRLPHEQPVKRTLRASQAIGHLEALHVAAFCTGSSPGLANK
jgi:hypothetical protein